jgi:hypothetical protein
MSSLDTFSDLVTHPLEASWRERVFDLVPFVGRAIPGTRARAVLSEAVDAYLLGLDLASLTLARTTAEQIIHELVRADSPPRCVAPSSPWYRKRHLHLPRGSGRNSLAVRIEALHTVGRLTDEDAEAFHEIREAGNRAVHTGLRGDTLGALRRLRHIIRYLGTEAQPQPKP